MYYWGKNSWGQYPWGESSVDATMELSLIPITIELYTGAELVANLPVISVAMTSTSAGANMALTLNRIYVSMTGGWIAPATMDIILPMMQVVMTSPGGTFATMAVTLPVIEFYGYGSGRVYTTVVVSTKDGAVTTYSNHSFNSYFEFMGEFYGVNSSGIYRLSGSDDAGTAINAQFITGYTDFKSKMAKSPTDLYTSLSSSGVVDVRNVIDNLESVIYQYASTDSRYRVRKINFGKGRTGSKMGISMSSSSAFQVDSLKLVAEEKNRYHPGDETWIRAIIPSIRVSMVSD